jgi:hypothetical protein
MPTISEMRAIDLVHPNYLYRLYKDYKYLYDFWENNRNTRRVSDEDMRNRIKYILKNNVKQRDEIATLCWILGEEDARRINY